MDSNTEKKTPVALREEATLKFWQENKIFEQTLSKEAPKGEYVFYDGPPFATGLPHYGHILASVIKDAIPRYKTMQGYKVPRRWGWDCHGLPIENIVEKDLNVTGRKQIEALGVDVFNEYARTKVLTYVHDWKKTIDRIGRWVDFDGSYKTMDNSYIESVWWGLKQLNDKKAIYEGTRVLPYCPKDETPISNSEIAMDNSYKDISDISAYVKFELVDEPGTYLLAWTTTPWTLPGNFALAVNKEHVYATVSNENEGKKEIFILSKERFEKIKDKFNNPQVLSEQKGSKIVGKKYKPVFPYFLNTDFPDKKNSWKVYGADFVTEADGTGIVHIAPGYGEDDMNLAKKEGIPFIHHVTTEGTFAPIVTDFAGQKVKPKDDHQSGDVLIIKYLAHNGFLFAKEKIIHPYPHCHRCETPLIYYALPAWFIDIQSVKKQLIKKNEDINWVPAYLKHGRFGKIMEGAPDWNISRNRFWASPLPFWKSEDGKEMECIASIEDLKKKTTRDNTFFLVRHGESENNVKNILSTKPENPHHLTEKGKEQVQACAKLLKKKKIKAIYASDFLRTKETAEIIADAIGFSKDKIIFDTRLREVNFGSFEGKNIKDYYQEVAPGYAAAFEGKIGGGENLTDVKKRMGDFIYEIDRKHEGESILVISHETPLWMLSTAIEGLNKDEAIAMRTEGVQFITNGEVRETPFAEIPHNAKYELDLHRPYIDDITWQSKSGKTMKRITEVIDCWFESGAMPFAANHYPFENKDWLAKHLPADFVVEYIAQTRTWFYYMHVISNMIFGKIPFKNVLATGTVLAEDGQKMSKSKNNFPDPWILFDKYGVDPIRYYLLSSPLQKSEDMNFSEQDVDSIYKKLVLRLENVLSFYELYKDDSIAPSDASHSMIDQWIIVRLKETILHITKGFEIYELDNATRLIDTFIDDLSTWYVRRSRDRFKDSENKKDRADALATTRFVLNTFAKALAPVMPFIAEHLYSKTKSANDPISVHLTSWPIFHKESVESTFAQNVLVEMKAVRTIVSSALEARVKTNIKVRQPLASLSLRYPLAEEYLDLIKDEVNVKKIIIDKALEKDLMLDTTITPELKLEGAMRELLRGIQEKRKEAGLAPKDIATAHIPDTEENKTIVELFKKIIVGTATLKEIVFEKREDVAVKKV